MTKELIIKCKQSMFAYLVIYFAAQTQPCLPLPEEK